MEPIGQENVRIAMINNLAEYNWSQKLGRIRYYRSRGWMINDIAWALDVQPRLVRLIVMRDNRSQRRKRKRRAATIRRKRRLASISRMANDMPRDWPGSPDEYQRCVTMNFGEVDSGS